MHHRWTQHRWTFAALAASVIVLAFTADSVAKRTKARPPATTTAPTTRPAEDPKGAPVSAKTAKTRATQVQAAKTADKGRTKSALDKMSAQLKGLEAALRNKKPTPPPATQPAPATQETRKQRLARERRERELELERQRELQSGRD